MRIRFIRMIMIVLLLSIASPALSFAKVAIGIKGGLGYSDFGSNRNAVSVLYNDGQTTYMIQELARDIRHSFEGGGFVRFGLGQNFSVQTEILYGDKGARTLGSPTEWVFKYIDIPVLGKYDYYVSRRTSIFALTGIECGINTLSQFRIINGIGQLYTYDLQNVKEIDWRGVAGTGVNFELNKLILSFELRYTFGFGSIAGDDIPPIIIPDTIYLTKAGRDIKTRHFALQAGLGVEL